MVQRSLQEECSAASDLPSSEEMTDAEIEALFYQVRWPRMGEPTCPRCGTGDPYPIKSRRMWRCSNFRQCRADFTLLSGTLFHAGKLPLRVYLAACEAFANRLQWRCGREIARAARVSEKVGYALSLKLETLVSKEETLTPGEVLMRALRADPQPQVWNKLLRRNRAWG
jgi:transposase-like protein